MHKNTKNLLGMRIGTLTVVKYKGVNKNGCVLWECLCDCGNVIIRRGSGLTNKDRPNLKHCGCITEIWKTHGMTKSRPYRCWSNMKERCLNPLHKSYVDYGGRGITIDPKWLESFEAFWDDMKDGYQKGLTLDRIDNDKNYTKENCTWSTPLTQANNRRSNFVITIPEGTMTIAQAARIYNIHRMTLHHRITHGWSIDDALNVPVKRKI